MRNNSIIKNERVEENSKPKLLRSHQKYVEYVGKKLKPKPKTFYTFKNNGFFTLDSETRLLIMSDIHSITLDVIDSLVKKKKIDKNTIVITCGDMAGNGHIGGDGNPYDSYVKILESSKLFFFVQGNHDDFDKRANLLKNSDGSTCCVEGILQTTPIGTITGLNGVIAKDKYVNPKKHKYSQELYYERLDYILKLKPDIVLTHQPLSDDDITRQKSIHVPKIRICGHQHNEDWFVMSHNQDTGKLEHISMNMDNKIAEFI